MERKERKVEYTEEDLFDKKGNFFDVVDRIEKNNCYMKTILYLNLMYFNHKDQNVTVQMVNKVVGKSYDYTNKILNFYVSKGILNKTPLLKDRKVRFVLGSKKDFIKAADYAIRKFKGETR